MSVANSKVGSLVDRSVKWARVDARHDVVAGLTVAVMGVPQAMAYALIAGLPPVYGLYTAVITCVVAAVLGSSNHLVTGPTNAICMVVLSLTAHLSDRYKINVLEVVLLLTFLTGLIQIAFGLLRMGGIVRYVSNSVIVGFTAGAGILIATNQVKNVLGFGFGDNEGHVETYFEVVVETIRHLPDTNPNALILAALTAVVVVVGPKINKRIPAALIAVVLAGLLAYFLGWHEAGPRKVDIVMDIEEISLDTLKLGHFHLPELIAHPNLALTREIGMGALALAILGLIEAASIARAIASQSGQRLDFTREFVAQGAGNVAGSFFLSFAGSGSFTRSAVCFKGGGRTRMAAIFSALWTALMVVALAPVANYIPKASLAGLLVVIAYTMIDQQRLVLTWKSGSNSRLVLMGTLISTLVLPLEYAIFVGIFLSIVFLLRIIGQADLTQLVPGDETGFEEVPFNRAPVSPVAVVNMEGDLYFAAVEDLDYELLRVIKPETRVIVLRMKRLRAVGSTAMAMLTHFWELLHSRGIHLVVCGIEEEMHKIMTNSGLQKEIGEQNIFYADNKLFQSTELAMARAWSIVKSGEGEAPAVGEVAPESRTVMAGDLVSKRCIRFGASHPLREGVWLMSQLYQRSRLVETQTMFLQDREGKLGAGLTTWDLLRELSRGLGSAGGHPGLNATATALRTNFETRLDTIARSDVPRFTERTPLNELVKTSLKDDLRVLPVCDDEGRIIGVVDQTALIRGIGRMLGIGPDQDQEKGNKNV